VIFKNKGNKGKRLAIFSCSDATLSILLKVYFNVKYCRKIRNSRHKEKITKKSLDTSKFLNK